MSERIKTRRRRGRGHRGGAGDPMDKIAALRQDAEIQYLETKTQALKRSIENSERMASSNISRNENEKNTNRANVVFKIISGIVRPLGPILRDLAPYIALIIIILLLVGIGFSSSGGPSMNLNAGSARRDAIFNNTFGLFGRIQRAIASFFARFSLGHRFRLIMRMINPFGPAYQNVIERPRAGTGRCNNIDWIENGDQCENLMSPSAIEWEISPDKVAEWDRLPDDIRAGFKKKMKVYIPWAKQDTFYVPQCAKAYYLVAVRDLSTGKLSIQQKLLNDNERTRFLQDTGLECVRVQKTLPKVFTPQYRAVSAAAVDAYTKGPN